VTDKLLRHIEENMKVPIIPRHYLKVNVEGETKTAEIISHPNTHPSFDHYTKSEIARDIKENVCRILDPKGDKYYIFNFSSELVLLQILKRLNMNFQMERE